MARPEDQEGPVVDKLFDTAAFTPSSPTLHSPHGIPDCAQDGDGSGSYMGSDDTLPDLNHHEPEIQHDSLGSCIEETQFVGLFLETQKFDEPQSSLQNPAKLSQPVTTGARASARPMSPPYVPTIERPKVTDPSDGVGFKFAKPQKHPIFDFGRHPGKATDINTNTTSPATSADTSNLNPSVQAQSNARHVLLPSNPVQNNSLPASEKMKAPSDINDGKNAGTAGPPTPTGISQTSSTNLVNEKDRDPSRQQVPRNIEASDTPMSKPALPLESPAKETEPYPDQPLPHKAVLKAANKSNKRSTMRQAFPPFPDVLQPPRGGSLEGGTPAANRQISASTSHPLQSVDVNSLLRDSISNKQNSELTNGNAIGAQDDTNGSIDTIINGQRSRPYILSFSQKNAQQTAVHDNPAPVEGAGVQADPILPLAANRHHNETQREWRQIPDQLEQTLLQHHPHDDRETLHQEDSHKAQMGHVNLQSESDGELHHLFQPISQPPSRSQSVLSNTARPMVRPLVADELVPQGVPEYPILHFKQPMKVQKPNSGPTQIAQRFKSNPEHINQRTNSTSTASSIQAFRQNLVQMEEALDDYEYQKSLIESQQGELHCQAAKLQSQQRELESQQSILESRQAEITELKLATAESNKQVKCLEEEKAALTVKVKKFTEICARYKAHMNDVVVAQTHLMSESSKIKENSAKIREESKAILKVHGDRESHESKLRSLINHAKSIRPPVERMVELEEENTKYKAKIENVEKTNVLLQSELNARMVDLGRERHSTEQLQKNLNTQSESHKELVETFKRAQSTMVDELTKEGSVLANLVNSDQSIHAKIDELSIFINTVSTRVLDLPPALIRLIEDQYARIENKLQETESRDVGLKESSRELFEDLKKRINQLRLDDGTKASLNERISELRESNATLTASGSARDLECQGMLQRIDELGRELSSYRDQLTVKSDELAALRALPKEDPILLGKIHDLENAKTILQGQLDTANQEASEAKEELTFSREIALSTQEQTQDLQCKLTEAQTSLTTLREDKRKYLASHKGEVDKARQEIAKSLSASKAEAQLKYDCLAKNLEQRRSEAEKELTRIQEKLQKSEEESARYSNNFTNLQEELSACKKQLTQQTIYIKHAGQCNPSRDEFDRREQNLQQVLKDMVEIKAHFDAAQNDISKKLERFVSHQQQPETLIQRIDSLEKENVAIQEQYSEIRKAHNTFRDNVSRYLRRSGVLLGEQSADEFVAAIPVHSPRKMGPPAIPTPKFITNQPSIASFNPMPSQAGLVEDQGFTSGLSRTPKEALRRNEQKQGSSTQRTANLLRDNDATPSSNLCEKSKVTTGTTNPSITKKGVELSIHFQSGSPYQTPKPLRPANRKSSDLAQSVQIEKSSESSQRVSAPSSVPDHVPSRTHMTSQIPTNMIKCSAESSRSSSIRSLGSSEQPRPSASNAASSRTEGISLTSHTLTDASFSAAPLLISSSSLSELSMLDHVGCNDEELDKAHVQDKEIKNGLPINEGNVETFTPMQTFAAKMATGVVHFKATPSRNQFSDDDDLSGVNTIKRLRPLVPSFTEESARRRESKPLKSALRTGSKKQTTTSANDTQSDIYQIPDSAPIAAALQKPFSRANTNKKQQAQGRKGNVGSSYNRIASGSKPGSISQSSGTLSTAHQKSATNSIVSNSEKSPLMKAPARMARKRSVSMSEANSQQNRPFKQYRVSLPNQGQRTSRTVIPDSQGAAKYRY